MRFTLCNAEQRTREWYVARLGRLTGSRAGDILARLKSGDEAASRRDYRTQLAIERITGEPQEDGYVSKEMHRGAEMEPLAFAAYEAQTGLIARRTGFLVMSQYMAGCSLDGDVENFTGIVEFKCPKSAIHAGYIRAKRVPREYVAQITHNLWVSGAQWADFVSFDPRMPEKLQFFRLRVERDEKAIADYEAQALRFLAEVSVEVSELMALQAAA